MARPRKTIDIELIKKLAAIQCTWEEICSIVEISRRTIERRYAQVIEDARNNGKMSLKRKQYEVAMSGNPQMLIWLGKQHLGQRDKTEIDLARLPDEVLAQEAKRRVGEPEGTT